jgi:hypothetical protein
VSRNANRAREFPLFDDTSEIEGGYRQRHSLSEAQASRAQQSGIEALRGKRYRLRLGQCFTSVGDPLRTPPKSLML